MEISTSQFLKIKIGRQKKRYGGGWIKIIGFFNSNFGYFVNLLSMK